MKIYNYSTFTIYVEGVAIEDQVTDLPDTFRGDVHIGSVLLNWDTDNAYQYLMVYEDNGLQLLHPVVKPPPFVTFFWLFICVFFTAFCVKLIQKIKMI